MDYKSYVNVVYTSSLSAILDTLVHLSLIFYEKKQN